MRLEDALEVTAVLADQLEEQAAADAFSLDGQRHLERPAIPHVGVGVSMGRSPLDVRIAVRGWTSEDIRHFELSSLDKLPLSQAELDIVVTGEIYATPPTSLAANATRFTARCQPVHPGVSIGHVNVLAGTLAALVDVDVNGLLETHMLSNNHILANSISASNPNAARRGDGILQPGSFDGGTPPAVGQLWKWVTLQARGNTADAALAACDASVGWDPTVLGIGAVSGTVVPTHGAQVQKVGRTTGHTLGTISAFPVRSLPVKFGSAVYRFDEVLEVSGQGAAFSAPGDSGALILDMSRAAVGLLFAGSRTVTYGNPISRVKTELGFSRIQGA
jgi:hypothetical protein